MYFYLHLYKNVLWVLIWTASAIQMSTHNICFYKENRKWYHISIIKYAPHEVLCWSSVDLSIKCVFIRWIFYYMFLSTFEKSVVNRSNTVFIPHRSFYWCLGRAVLPDCGISWVSSLIIFHGINIIKPRLRECAMDRKKSRFSNNSSFGIRL